MSLWLADPFDGTNEATTSSTANKMCSFPNPNAICDTINGELDDLPLSTHSLQPMGSWGCRRTVNA